MSAVLDTKETPARPNSVPVTVIEPVRGFQLLDWKELFYYRDLFRFLVWRQIKIRYAQSAVGIGWALIQPLFSMLVLTIVFGMLAKIKSDGSPYGLFSFAALVPWTFFSNGLSDGVASLVTEADMLRKIYFPRLLLPLSAIAAKLVDFCIATVMLFVLMAIYRHAPSTNIVWLPLLIVLMVVSAAGASVWLSALAVQYRDVKHAMVFIIQLAMYAAPVIYSTNIIPAKFRLLYALNPMVGVIEGFRSALLGTQPMPWSLIAVGYVAATMVLLSGLAFFRSRERVFADVA